MRYWLHVSCTNGLTYYAFHKSRGKVATDEIGILPNYTGRAIHDNWATYFTYNCSHGLCNAHHLRELTGVYEQENASWSKEMIELLVEIKEEVDKSKSNFELGLNTLKLLAFEKRYTDILSKGQTFYPFIKKQTKKKGKEKQIKGKNLLDRFREHREEVLIFMYDFDVPFDNNQAERDIRMMKLKQKISGCFRSELGAKIFCRIRGYISTVRKQGLNPFEAIKKAFDNDPFKPVFS